MRFTIFCLDLNFARCLVTCPLSPLGALLFYTKAHNISYARRIFMMAEPFTKKVLYNLLYAVRAKSEHIYVALGDDCDPAILKPYVEPGREIQHLFTYFLERITHDGKTTKEDLVKALNSQIVRHGVLARKLKEDQTITDGKNFIHSNNTV